MTTTPRDLRYTKEHEWVKSDAECTRVGITHYAQLELGDVVFVELPELGRQVKKGQSFGVVESVKAVSDVYAPIDGKVVGRNDAVLSSPELINNDPYGQGWMITVEPANKAQLEELLTGEGYDAFLKSLEK